MRKILQKQNIDLSKIVCINVRDSEYLKRIFPTKICLIMIEEMLKLMII